MCIIVGELKVSLILTVDFCFRSQPMRGFFLMVVKKVAPGLSLKNGQNMSMILLWIILLK